MARRLVSITTLVSSALVLPAADLLSARSSYTSGAAWLPAGHNLRSALSQETTNGKSVLGTLDAKRLSSWLDADGTPLPQGTPWGTRTCNDTNAYQDPPHTGMIRSYVFNVSKQVIAPDGVNKSAIVINGAFPGPLVEANWGDWIQVTVRNDMDEGTSLHWHGLLQKETPWYDGVPSVHQCPVAPGSSFTYQFRADLYGSSWYHSHYSAQTAGGLSGPMIIHGPHDNAEYDIDLGAVMVSDWYHEDYRSLVELAMAPVTQKTYPPESQNVLINGKMNFPCKTNSTGCTPNAGLSKFRFESGKLHRLRIINSGSEALQKFSIDKHQMTVIANDYVPVVPYGIDVLTLGVGQRTDIIVKATGQPADSAWMRSNAKSVLQGGCATSDGESTEAVAAIYYEHADSNSVPTTETDVAPARILDCSNDALAQTIPYYAMKPAQDPSQKQIDITFRSNGTHMLWYLNNQTFHADYDDPLLLEASLGNLNFPPMSNVLDVGSNSSSVRIAVYNHDLYAGYHPMHFHGHNMYILAEGFGLWNGTITSPNNPQRRDTHIIARAMDMKTPSYMIMQFDLDNPGIWPFHCHVNWHLTGGFYINILENADAIKRMHIPSTLGQTCRDWAAWTGEHVVDEIDAGL